MDSKLLEQKLENLRRCVQRIEQKYSSATAAINEDFDLQDIIALNLERAVQSCIDIAAHLAADLDDAGTMSSAALFSELGKHSIIPPELGLKMGKAAGFRNLLVHRYTSIDWIRVYAALPEDIKTLRAFASAVASHYRL